MSDHKARALEIAMEYETMCVSAGIGRPFGFAGLYLLILHAIRTARRETLEEAARVAETFHPDDDRMDRQIKIHVAQAIRSLAVNEGEG
jgi:hypothetical protein